MALGAVAAHPLPPADNDIGLSFVHEDDFRQSQADNDTFGPGLRTASHVSGLRRQCATTTNIDDHPKCLGRWMPIGGQRGGVQQRSVIIIILIIIVIMIVTVIVIIAIVIIVIAIIITMIIIIIILVVIISHECFQRPTETTTYIDRAARLRGQPPVRPEAPQQIQQDNACHYY